MTDNIFESDMNFLSENAFYIEKSNLYTNIGSGIRSVEFIRAIDDELLFVEAKKSFPNPDNPDEENVKRYRSEVTKICEKFVHSLNLYASAVTGVSDETIGDDFSVPDSISLTFVLVIKDHELKWCKEVKQSLLSAIPAYYLKIWKPMVQVTNQTEATKRGLIAS